MDEDDVVEVNDEDDDDRCRSCGRPLGKDKFGECDRCLGE